MPVEHYQTNVNNLDQGVEKISSLFNQPEIIISIPRESEIPIDPDERKVFLEKMSEECFTTSEKERWDSETRKLLMVFSAHHLLSLEQITDMPDGVRSVICDTDGFKDMRDWSQIKSEVFSCTQKASKFDILTGFSQKLGPVYSKEEFFNALGDEDLSNQKNIKAKKLFYVPNKSPLDLEEIKKIDAHLGFWDVSNYIPEYLESCPEYPAEEVMVAALIYGRSWGNADERIGNDDNPLTVTYLDGSKGRISGRFFLERGFGGFNKEFWHSPSGYTTQHFPDLVEKGMLLPNDFRRISISGGSLESTRLVDRALGNSGRVMVDGIAYILGSEYENNNFRVSKISPDFFCVVKVDGEGSKTKLEVVKIVSLLGDEEKNRRRNERGFPYIGKTELEQKHLMYSPQEFVDKNPEVGSVVLEWQKFLSFSNSMEAVGINVVGMSAEEQVQLWSIYSDKKSLELANSLLSDISFSPEQKQDRIKTLIAINTYVNDLGNVLKLNRLRGADSLFQSMSQILDIVNNANLQVSKNKGLIKAESERINMIGEAIKSQAARIFLGASELASSKEKGISIQDATYALIGYKKMVKRWYEDEFLRNDVGKTEYMKLLRVFDDVTEGSNMKILLLKMIEQAWKDDVNNEVLRDTERLNTTSRIVEFYSNNKELFNTSDETTGDTERELSALRKFFDSFDSVEGYVLDLACGDRERITEPMADMLKGKARVFGMDMWSPPGENKHENLDVALGTIDNIPLPDHSVGVVTLNWSPPNDWVNRGDQLRNFNEIGRVTRIGGILRADVAYLEGGEGSWAPLANEQYLLGSEKFGDIKVAFPGGRNGQFHIYPLSELKAMLSSVGFGDISAEIWTTKAGKPRVTLTAEYKGKQVNL